MRKQLIIVYILSAMLANVAAAQYYYKDILSNKQLIAEMTKYKEQNIKIIDVHSFEADQEPSKDFFCEKKISKDYRKIETYTRSEGTGKTLLTSYFNKDGFLERSIDSSATNASSSLYRYDNNGNLISTTTNSRSSDADYVTSSMEIHLYAYNDKGQLQKMWRIKNNKDTTEIDFVIDENGNVAEEIPTAIDDTHYYYYYNEKRQLTDIVRYNDIRQKLVPAFIFEYNYVGQVTQMVTVKDGIGSDYNTWQYLYDDGLRIKEKCYSKKKELLGYFEYEYK